MRVRILTLVSAATLFACSGSASKPDAGSPNPTDGGHADAGPVDAGPTDAGRSDAGPVDAGPVDAGLGDAGPTDAGPVDAGPGDAGTMDAGPGDAGATDAGVDAGSTGLEQVPLTATVTASVLTGPVDVVRDTYGNPHIYGNALPDVAFAQGYMVAHDRLIQLDFQRHSADGTLGYLVGALNSAVLPGDIQMRVHHLRAQATTTYNALAASADPNDQLLKTSLDRFADGVNAYVTDLKAGHYHLPTQYSLYYSSASFEPWTAIDSVLLGELLAFQLAFDAADDIMDTALITESQAAFDQSSDPNLRARAGLGADLQIAAPADPTQTIPGWTGFNGDTSTAKRDRLHRGRARSGVRGKSSGGAPPDQLLRDDLAALASLKLVDHHHLHGSNNWIVGPTLSATGNVMVANDTHLSIDNPATFWITHLVNRGSDQPIDVMGEQLPGVPMVTLGVNQHVAWGATVNFIDVTDVYQESVVGCGGDGGLPDPDAGLLSDGGGYCVLFQGQQVPLVPDVETFQLGYKGVVGNTVSYTLYRAPQHGPIIPRVLTSTQGAVVGIDPLRSQELSVRYTGYTAAPIIKAIFGLDKAASVQDAKAALDANFGYGGQNWVLGDDQGNFGWTETCQVPLRAPPVGAQQNLPWQILPGDGSAEWRGYMDPRYIPHAFNPAQGFIATSNNDPIGATAANNPFLGQPSVDGGPLYLGTFYDPGTRVGRSTRRLSGYADAGHPITIDDMQSVQADAITEWGQGFAPTFLDATAALLGEAAALADAGALSDGGFPGPYPELGALVLAAQADGGSPIALLTQAQALVTGWTFDTPTGVASDSPTAQQIADSQATAILAMWSSYFAHDTLDDELAHFDPKQVQVGELEEEKLMLFLVQSPRPAFLSTGLSSTGDSVLFDNLGTPGVIESKRMIAAQAALETLGGLVAKLGPDPTAWTWGTLHTVTLNFFLGAGLVPSLSIPPPTDPTFPGGYPRHGDNGTVDVGPRGLSTTDFAYEDLGPAIRFVAELDPVNGPTARNALPGGEIFDPASPHYSDQMQLWRKNQTYDYAFKDSDVIAAAMQEYTNTGTGRTRFQP
jgi:penicillin amidase